MFLQMEFPNGRARLSFASGILGETKSSNFLNYMIVVSQNVEFVEDALNEFRRIAKRTWAKPMACRCGTANKIK